MHRDLLYRVVENNTSVLFLFDISVAYTFNTLGFRGTAETQLRAW